MKKNPCQKICLILIPALLILLCAACTGEKSPLQQTVENSFANAETVYYKVWDFDAYGDTCPVYITAMDASVPFPHAYLTDSLAALEAFPFSQYEESKLAARDQLHTGSFWLDSDSGLLKVTIGVNTEQEPMVVTVQAPDGASLNLSGPYSEDLFTVATQAGSIQTISEKTEDAVLVTDLTAYYREPVILSRGYSAKFQALLELVFSHADPESGGSPEFDFQLDAGSAGICLVDTAGYYLQRQGEDAVYPVSEESRRELIAALPSLA